MEFNVQLKTVKIEKPDDTNFILGQTHFIKLVEDIHETLVRAVPGIKFGLAFCEASGKCLVRWSGTDPGMSELAKKNANPTEVVLAETDQGRGILGVVDEFSPKGIEDEGDIKWRKDFLRQIGYKL